MPQLTANLILDYANGSRLYLRDVPVELDEDRSFRFDGRRWLVHHNRNEPDPREPAGSPELTWLVAEEEASS